ERLCTRKLAYRLLPDLYSRRLECVCEHLQITNQQAHRAMGDVMATAEVFNRFLTMLAERGVQSIDGLKRFESLPAWKCQAIDQNQQV
ncbi:hypothetical protein KY363_05000, partial [Candidatus Woesearchaeota archaeon]|nr:hypothetical protein [Candidatus Woesearchaeota archaeon]